MVDLPLCKATFSSFETLLWSQIGPPPPFGFGAAAFPSPLRFEAKAGGGGGNRTHVRKSSAANSTCLSGFTITSNEHSKRGKETHAMPSQEFLEESLGEIRTSEKSANVTPRPEPRTEQGRRLRVFTQLRLTHRWHLSSLPSLFTRIDSLDMHLLPQLLPSNPSRPHSILTLNKMLFATMSFNQGVWTADSQPLKVCAIPWWLHICSTK